AAPDATASVVQENLEKTVIPESPETVNLLRSTTMQI
ncbi:hypothetical protein A2U01_0103389, partial [Trifolium medium]|nr:hypothetical protein [Trifolium medium]